MAKQPKKSKTASVSNRSNLLTKFIPRTKKAQFLTFLVVFALIGGGVMAYRSFAAVQGSSQGFAGINLAPSKQSDAKMIKETSGSKSNTSVWEMTGGSGNKFLGNKQAVTLPTNTSEVRTCANVRLMAGSGQFVLTHPNGQGFSETISIRGTSTYNVYCTAFRKPSNPTTQERYAQVGWGFGNNQTLRVGSVSIEYRTGAGK